MRRLTDSFKRSLAEVRLKTTSTISVSCISAVEDGADVELAYAALISALLRDPEFIIY